MDAIDHLQTHVCLNTPRYRQSPAENRTRERRLPKRYTLTLALQTPPSILQ